ncbi:SDR family NAD(P)-dependent oxidoreductase [Mycolicibacterium elephantis]|uniref:3-hydroxy-2-methylbutyryl-CoA dehydrogenase n=1 Tax=Mycolicibacterium elephantis DSM 44368 TaxID=1335622 RepID=A0A439DT06_9MYCO|nr:SDR family NAD(P)-dependent oxidoreductase [Mycolicibacterium elephantis]MCV7222098.1 SDR family NAD(P)-dependent oxidoreductase [Mycolicibacterium elephantis]RWA19472.1 3-hydroxy-2-methylbutyryl-CoA dehydrogenase [Mycolicibacterium elephantis DSM 44368]
MHIEGSSAIVTGGASGLGRASAQRLAEAGAHVVIVDLPTSAAAAVAGELGGKSTFVAADVTDAEQVQAAVDTAVDLAPLRTLVHCAGRGGPVRVLDRAGEPGSLEDYVDTVSINLVGTFNTLRLVAAAMARNEPQRSEHGDRGVCVLTASVAAWEGQIGQTAYASSKAGIVGMTVVAARDLASKQIRVCTIAPGIFDTPLLARVPDAARASLAAAVPHPRRLGDPSEFAALAMHIVENDMLNGETIRLDGAIRMAPR